MTNLVDKLPSMQPIDCPLCKNISGFSILEFEDCLNVPYFKRRLSRTEVKHLLGNILITYCKKCGHVWNEKFQEASGHRIYATDTLSCTPVTKSMTKRHQTLAILLAKFIKINGTVADIGGGSGALAEALADLNYNVDLYEPSLSIKQFASKLNNNVTIINDLFSYKEKKKYDGIILKQVLEHVFEPINLIDTINKSLSAGGIFYLEVPRFEWIRDNQSIVDFHYPHYSYFTEENIISMLDNSGFEIMEIHSLIEGHDIGYVTRKMSNRKEFSLKKDKKSLAIDLKLFNETYLKGISKAKNLSNYKVGLYGATSHMQSFLGLFGKYLGKISHVFDDNPISQGKYTLVNGYQPMIKSPSKDNIKGLDFIVICTYLHDEIITDKLIRMGFEGEILSLRPKSVRNEANCSSFFS